MTFRYQSGEDIQKGDNILFHEEQGEVEFVTTKLGDDPEHDWYIQEFGGGVAIKSPSFGRVFISDVDNTEDLVFVSRG
jgi:hypothetical protein